MRPKYWPKEFTYSSESLLKDCDWFTLKLYLRCCFGQENDPDVVSALIAQGKVHPDIALALLKKPHPRWSGATHRLWGCLLGKQALVSDNSRRDFFLDAIGLDDQFEKKSSIVSSLSTMPK